MLHYRSRLTRLAKSPFSVCKTAKGVFGDVLLKEAAGRGDAYHVNGVDNACHP